MAEISEEMKRAGWRELTARQCLRHDTPTGTPGILAAWEARGGRWAYTNEDGTITILTRGAYILPGLANGTQRLWRPVSPSTWDYDPRGWGEDLTPTLAQVRDGVCWHLGRVSPGRVLPFLLVDKDGRLRVTSFYVGAWPLESDDTEWLGPITGLSSP